ncbi:MAG TPA: SRPBCC family protein [Candidatus Polarisedimenticolia bacterium]|nr:SRPBCC family protein [Candidatus Polarisedimenticolia bacterium]
MIGENTGPGRAQPSRPPRLAWGSEQDLATLETRLFLRRPVERVFDFFAQPSNLETITPPWLHFRILTPRPIVMREGTRIDYRLRVHGLPLRWCSEITSWDPPRRFVDEQIRGPYRVWIHEHEFVETGGGTEVRDRVRYAVPGGALVDRLLVRRDVGRIFEHRATRLREIFAERPG